MLVGKEEEEQEVFLLTKLVAIISYNSDMKSCKSY
jgi:hypothetical protein